MALFLCIFRLPNYVILFCHKHPLSTIREETKINPSTDLIPVCANCHRIIHRKKENILSIDEMKELVCKKESK